MQIGEIAKRTGFSKDTIRWYEKIGLIKANKTSRYENNYRKYNAEIIDRLLLIKKVKSLGFTLNEIKDFMLLHEHKELNCQSASKIFQNRLNIIENKILELEMFRSNLMQLKQACSGTCISKFDIDLMN